MSVKQTAARRWDRLTKPLGSLGRLEELGIRLSEIQGKEIPTLSRKVIFTVAADHGITAEGVSAYPKEVTAQMVLNFLRGGAAINVLARHAGAEVVVVDAGVAADLSDHKGLVHCKIRPGTANFLKERAMARSEAETAVESGRRLFRETYAGRPIDLVGLGEMGIGNTTASAALASLFTGLGPERVTGRGTGVAEGQLGKKVTVIRQALELHQPDPQDPIECLSCVGGLEIACLAGVVLAATEARVPVVLDGFITTVAARAALGLEPRVKEILLASHLSVEPGHRILLTQMGLEPLLDLRMRLGEGTGAALAFTLLDASVKLLSEMATFDEAGVSEKES
ncbi:MAG: nicotinate-nucleotide--dimethylbenzimidazole phosphoribosyltransferase [Candidatus Omnitrophica bacterium]|nr:nicotinate-nucleotide--dimethylbenzimidazole phosphoribosyltransferase [Candidatus Omnitrophota bacterium]